jgi:hypothetical protein
MSTTPIASYGFLSWARHGLGGEVQNAPAGALRGTISVGVTIRGARIGGGEQVVSVDRQVALYGPGDIVGIDPRAIVRTEPRPWITNFENNYLPFVEFYDEDFPWRYTPAAPSPDKRRLTPWIALVVLEESEFEDASNVLNRPLPFIKVSSAASRFPPADQLWAWAHVHLNDSLSGVDPNDLAALSLRLETTLTADRDRAYSRLLCPRALKANAGYHAFVVPTFESGRLAGLGLDPAGASSATRCAWDGPTIEPEHYPYYHRWYFRTGSVGDFEYLVRLLQPKPADPRVGTRDIDVQAPGPGIPGIENPELAGVLRLGGALRVPLDTLPKEARDEFTKYDEWARPFPQPFQQSAAALLNLPATYAESGADDDPLIVPPIYGRWHAAVTRLLDGPIDSVEDREKWLNELNLDPRYRVAAGFGTDVVQKNQDKYMEAAWRQVGDVLAGNQKIRYAQMALAASRVWNTKYLAPALARSPERYLTLAAPVHRRVLAEGVTFQHRVRESPVPPAAFSKTMRQAVRPRGRVAQRAGFDAARNAATLIGRINRGDVTAAPPKVVPPTLPTSAAAVDALRSNALPPDLLDALRQRPWLRWAPLALAFVLLFLLLPLGAVASIFGLALVAAGIWLAEWIERAVAREDAVETLLPGRLTPEAVDRLPRSPEFRIAAPGTLPKPTTGDTDSEDARRFKSGLKSVARLEVAETAIPDPVRTPLPLETLATGVFGALRPERTIPSRTLLHVAIPSRIRDQQVDSFGEVMVYPEIDAPMYAPLTAISSEMFLPNIQLIEVNSITLLETNQKFIEAYMVGLNHEFASELLWREYPTDQRGSYFRQFWDASGFLAEPGADPAALRERLRDIPELHRWLRTSNLGDHDHREEQGDKEEEVVLVIRGELLKKYPTAVIYAHRADWQRDADGAIDKGQPRRLQDLAPAEQAHPPRDIVKTPLYEAKVDPDIYFFGFDLTARIAKGGFIPPGATEEDPGWFFVIKERPGEPRFGLDLPASAPGNVFHVWSDLAWSDVMIPFTEGASLRAGQQQITLTDPGSGAIEKEQYEDDKRFAWRTDTHAAELAYILYQVPVLMAVHAAEMLPKDAS